MRELGKKEEVLDKKVTDLTLISEVWMEPEGLPFISPGELLICGMDVHVYETLYVIETLEDLKALFREFARGWALGMKLYRGKMPVKSTSIGPDNQVVNLIIGEVIPNAPDEVKQAIVSYAQGNPGAARVLTLRAVNFTTAQEVEDLVGWPLSEHSLKRTSEIWDKLRS